MNGRHRILGGAALAAVAVFAAQATAQSTNPRFGVWQMESDAPPPSKNIMTYAPFQSTGMSIKVEATSARGQDTAWGYETLFDGAFRPVWGQEGSETAVEIIDDRSTRILNKRDGKVYQVIINTLSEDGNTISNEYVRLDENGAITRVTHAVYKRIR